MDEERGIYTALQFTIEVQNRQHLARLMKTLRRIPEVVRITRLRDQTAR
jgi:guanosine-3',5'-bis(diphosphate) 3'-pyrophosphohydrolase